MRCNVPTGRTCWPPCFASISTIREKAWMHYVTPFAPTTRWPWKQSRIASNQAARNSAPLPWPPAAKSSKSWGTENNLVDADRIFAQLESDYRRRLYRLSK